MRRHVAVLAGWVILALSAQSTRGGEELRTWTDATGSAKKSAVFLRLEDNNVYLSLEDGSLRKIPLSKLSKADQEYARAAAENGDKSDPFEAVAGNPANQANTSSTLPDAVPLTAQSENEANLRLVVVEGVGVDVESAKKDAYRQAVRQVVGAYVDSTALVSQDQLVEDKVITLSSAFVEKSEPIREIKDGGLVRVRLRAHVRANQVLGALRSAKLSTVSVDAESLVGQAVTKADQAEGMEQLVTRILPGLQKSSLEVVVEGKPEVKTAAGDEAELVFWLRVQPRREAYIALAQKLDAALSAAERPSGEIVSPGTTLVGTDDFREHLKNLKEYKARYFLPRFFVAEADGTRIRQTLGRDGSSPVLKYDPIFALSDPTASVASRGNGLDLLANGSWDAVTRDKGEMILLILVHANETGARTRWKWFRLSAEEADLVIASLKASVRATAVLKDAAGEEIARESVVLKDVGVKLIQEKAITICPFFMIQDNFDDLTDYIPSISIQRSVRLLKSEVSTLKTIDAFVQEGEPFVVYGR